MNVSFKQLCSRVAAITGPWNCVVYRDIRLLKAHSCRVASPAIAWAMQLLVGVVLYVIPLCEAICAMRIPSFSQESIHLIIAEHSEANNHNIFWLRIFIC